MSKIIITLVEKKDLFQQKKIGRQIFVPERDIVNSWSIQKMINVGVLHPDTIPTKILAFAKDNKRLSNIWTGLTRVDNNKSHLFKADEIVTSIEYIGELSILLSKDKELIDIKEPPCIKEVAEYFAKNYIQPFQPLAVEAVLKLIGRMYGKKFKHTNPRLLGKIQYDLLDSVDNLNMNNLNSAAVEELKISLTNEEISTPLIQKGIELVSNTILYLEKYKENKDNVSEGTIQFYPSERWREKVKNNFIKYWEED